MKKLLYILLVALTTSACVTEEVPTGSLPQSIFEALWRTLDQHYCFFDYKNVDWQEVHDRYARQITDTMHREELFDTLSRMTYELKDGHVNLISSMNVSRYGAWFDDYPMNFSDSLLRKTLGRAEDFRSASGMQYRKLLPDSVGYVRVGSFDAALSQNARDEMLYYFRDCKALIIDIRHNGGGQLTAASALTSSFSTERRLVGYMQHKTGTAHDAFSAPEPIYVDPSPGVRWLRPVIILTNRRTYSAANSFAMYMHPLPHVALLGDRTGGGSGMPFTSELPYGWAIRFSASPMLTPDMQHTEFGIAPDYHVEITPEDYRRSTDTILEAALALIRKVYETLNSDNDGENDNPQVREPIFGEN